MAAPSLVHNGESDTDGLSQQDTEDLDSSVLVKLLNSNKEYSGIQKVRVH